MIITEIEAAIEYYIDLFAPLLGVCEGKMSFVEARLFIDDMYGGLL